jgi:hypothetical protein
LERVFNKAIFLAPKMYGGRINTKNLTMNDMFSGLYEYIKIKGVKIPIKFNQLLSLLYKNKSLNINQIKWFREKETSTIKIEETKHTLKLSNNKREMIFENGKFKSTKPLILHNYNKTDEKYKNNNLKL